MNFCRVGKQFDRDKILFLLKEEIRARGNNKVDSFDFFNNYDESLKIRKEIVTNMDLNDYTESLIELYRNDDEIKELIKSILNL